MGVEVAGSELSNVNGEMKSKSIDQNGKIILSEAITFGSHGVDDEPQSTGETSNQVSNARLVKDAVNEWPELETHHFWFVRHRPFEDPSLKTQIELLEKDIQKKNERINKLHEDLKIKNSEKSELYDEINAFRDEKSKYWDYMNEKREEMKPLQTALGSLRGGGGGEQGYGICSTEEELNHLIRSFEYRMQHETMSLKEEKQLVREIKELEATRPKVIAKVAERAKLQESMGKKETLEDQVKLFVTDLDGVRKQKEEVKLKIDRLSPQLTTVKNQCDVIKAELDTVKNQKRAAVESVKNLRSQRDAGNQYFNESRKIISQAKEFAVKKDVKALEELNIAEVDKFISQWNSNKAFRDDYENKLLTSLDYRQLSRDGRIRNFDEKPLVREESPKPNEIDVVSKAISKQPKEVAKTPLKSENQHAEKAHKESKMGSKESKIVSEQVEEEIFVVDKPKKDISNAEIDGEKLKEIKKQEEKEKQRQALERKKKLQDKAASKAALRAQREAEKKLKDRERKLRKKETSTVDPTNEEEPTGKSETDEPEKSDDVEEILETPASSKAKVKQENVVRHRKPVKKTRGTLPKAILKKKKSDKYWVWGSAAAAAAVAVLLLVVLGYKYLF